jgi:hypothetical protein
VICWSMFPSSVQSMSRFGGEDRGSLRFAASCVISSDMYRGKASSAGTRVRGEAMVAMYGVEDERGKPLGTSGAYTERIHLIGRASVRCPALLAAGVGDSTTGYLAIIRISKTPPTLTR